MGLRIEARTDSTVPDEEQLQVGRRVSGYQAGGLNVGQTFIRTSQDWPARGFVMLSVLHSMRES